MIRMMIGVDDVVIVALAMMMMMMSLSPSTLSITYAFPQSNSCIDTCVEQTINNGDDNDNHHDDGDSDSDYDCDDDDDDDNHDDGDRDSDDNCDDSDDGDESTKNFYSYLTLPSESATATNEYVGSILIEDTFRLESIKLIADDTSIFV